MKARIGALVLAATLAAAIPLTHPGRAEGNGC